MWEESQKKEGGKKCLRIFQKEKSPFESQESRRSDDVKMICRIWVLEVREKWA
jgi:hypothetical protein